MIMMKVSPKLVAARNGTNMFQRSKYTKTSPLFSTVLAHKLHMREEKGKIEEVTNEIVSTKTKDNKEFMMNVEVTDMTTKKLVKHNKMHSKTKHNVDNMYSV